MYGMHFLITHTCMYMYSVYVFYWFTNSRYIAHWIAHVHVPLKCRMYKSNHTAVNYSMCGHIRISSHNIS